MCRKGAQSQSAFRNEDEYVTQLLNVQAKKNQHDVQLAENAYTKDIARRDELKLIFKSLLEKNALGMLSDVEYNEFMTSCISECDSVDQRIAEYEASRAKSENTQDRPAEFAAYLFKPM